MIGLVYHIFFLIKLRRERETYTCGGYGFVSRPTQKVSFLGIREPETFYFRDICRFAREVPRVRRNILKPFFTSWFMTRSGSKKSNQKTIIKPLS